MTDVLMLLLLMCATKIFLSQTKQYFRRKPKISGRRAASHEWRFLLHLANCSDTILHLGW